MSHLHIAIAELLIDIEKELRELRLWDVASPSLEALQSRQPFAVDTLTFPQWLQFIFLPRMHDLVEGLHPLPHASGIAPMAEQYFSVLKPSSTTRLLAHLQQIDQLLTRP